MSKSPSLNQDFGNKQKENKRKNIYVKVGALFSFLDYFHHVTHVFRS